jgi:oligopeptide transport system substrate-binding protein
MRKVKWIFFGYLLMCMLVLAAIGVSFAVTRERDPLTNYTSYAANIKSLDPAEIGDTESGDIAGNVFECLYNYSYDKQKYELEDALADGGYQTTPDGLSITIRIKRGVHFYDPDQVVFPDGVGPEVTADDFIYSWKRVCNFHLGITANYAQMFQGHIRGIDDWFAYTQSCKTPNLIDWSKPISGLTAPDRYTLKIKLVTPFPQFQFNLAMIPTAVVCRAVVEHYGDHFRNHPVGTGPYILKKHLLEQQILFVENPVYRGGGTVQSGTKLTDAERLPHIKRVQYDYFTEELPRWYNFLDGMLDSNGIPKDTFQQAIHLGSGDLTEDMTRQGIRLIKSPEPQISYTGFNMTDPVVGKNKPLRQAISMAYNRAKYIELYLNGRGVEANGPIPPGFPTYDANRVDPYSKFDLAAARAKMKEAEAINGGPIPTLHMLIGATDTGATQDGDFFTAQMKQIGLNVDIDYTTWARFLQMIDEKQAQVYDLGWVADYPDEQDFWQLFYGKNGGPGGLNSCNYSNPAFDALYEKTQSMNPSPERDKLYEQMQDMVVEDCPWVFKFYPQTYLLYHDWEKKPRTMDYGYGMKAHLDIEFNQRSAWLRHH